MKAPARAPLVSRKDIHMARVQPSPFDIGAGGAPLGQLRARGGNFAALAALIVRLPLRKQVGFRNLSWSNIVVVTLALLVLQWFDNLHFNFFTLLGGGVIYGNHTSLRNFALAWAAVAIFEHYQRISEEKQGIEPHNFWQGDSRFGLKEFLPLSPKVIAYAVEPGLAFLAGAVLRRMGLSLLGWVVIVSALCFGVSEWRLYQRVKEDRRDKRDLGKEAQWEADLANESAGRYESPEGSEALHTGMAGLENEIANRRQATAESASGGTL
jgi:hypothetical protein